MPFSGPQFASCVASGTTEIQGHSQVCRVRHEGPRTPSTTTDANLDCAFVLKTNFLRRSLILKSQQNRIELVTRPVATAPISNLVSVPLLGVMTDTPDDIARNARLVRIRVRDCDPVLNARHLMTHLC